MKKEQLVKALSGIVVTFQNDFEVLSFLGEIKRFGGKWIDGQEICLEKEWFNKNKPIFRLHVDKKLVISKVCNTCFVLGAYPTIEYGKFYKKRV